MCGNNGIDLDSAGSPDALSGELGVVGSLSEPAAICPGCDGSPCSFSFCESEGSAGFAGFAVLLLLERKVKESRTCPKYVFMIPGRRLSTKSGRGVAAPGGVFAPEPM